MRRLGALVGAAWLIALLQPAILRAAEAIQAAPIWERPGEAAQDRQNLELNLRWVISRLRETDRQNQQRAVVGVYADAGAWHVGARSVVQALEAAGVPCRVLDRSALTPEGLQGLQAIVMPGGWSVFQKVAAGNSGLEAIRKFVENGGRYLGICAGAYLAAQQVRWQGETYPYPLQLFDGLAEGALPELAAWPKSAGVRVTVIEAGRRRGLAPAGNHDVF
ncbi:MAG: hypothetical protein IMZ44_01140 [Planctomycetes bacterium]|nr:hypothetical protein [Planctomycetota bacterium]